jgi:hypothetical protein
MTHKIIETIGLTYPYKIVRVEIITKEGMTPTKHTIDDYLTFGLHAVELLESKHPFYTIKTSTI